MTPKPARALAWLTFVIGILVSVAGNIGHAASDGMQPGEWAGAAFWPTALLLSVEILVRVRWQPEKRWTVARFTGLIVVSIVAAILSYLHLRSLLMFWQYGAFQATIGPLAVDGLMLIAASALLSISHEPRMVPESAQVPVSVPAQGQGQPEPAPVAVETTPQDAEIGRIIAVLEEEFPPDDPQPKRVQTSKTVPSTAAEEAAFQAWINAPSGDKPSVRKLADMAGLSPSKVHRLINGTGNRPGWKQLESAR